MFKKVLLWTLVLLMLCTTPLLAAEKVMVTRDSSNVFLSWGSSIGVYGAKFFCESYSTLVDEYSTSITMKLQKYVNGSWVTLKTWTASTYDAMIDLTYTYPCEPGIFRTYSTHKAGGETKTSYSPNFLYN